MTKRISELMSKQTNEWNNEQREKHKKKQIADVLTIQLINQRTSRETMSKGTIQTNKVITGPPS